jgi:titin
LDDTNEDGVKVYRKTDTTSFAEIEDLSAGTTTYSDSGLDPLTNYTYKVESYNSSFNIESNEVS